MFLEGLESLVLFFWFESGYCVARLVSNSLCRCGWPWALDLPAFTIQVLTSQTPYLVYVVLRGWTNTVPSDLCLQLRAETLEYRFCVLLHWIRQQLHLFIWGGGIDLCSCVHLCVCVHTWRPEEDDGWLHSTSYRVPSLELATLAVLLLQCLPPVLGLQMYTWSCPAFGCGFWVPELGSSRLCTYLSLPSGSWRMLGFTSQPGLIGSLTPISNLCSLLRVSKTGITVRAVRLAWCWALGQIGQRLWEMWCTSSSCLLKMLQSLCLLTGKVQRAFVFS